MLNILKIKLNSWPYHDLPPLVPACLHLPIMPTTTISITNIGCNPSAFCPTKRRLELLQPLKLPPLRYSYATSTPALRYSYSYPTLKILPLHYSYATPNPTLQPTLLPPLPCFYPYLTSYPTYPTYAQQFLPYPTYQPYFNPTLPTYPTLPTNPTYINNNFHR